MSGRALAGDGGESGDGVGVKVRLKMSLREPPPGILPTTPAPGDCCIGRWVAGEKVSDVGDGVTGCDGERGGESPDDIDDGSRSGSESTSTIRGRDQNGWIGKLSRC